MTKIIDSLEMFTRENFYDQNYGGFHAAINQSKNDIVTEDKTLVDIGLGLLAFSKTQNKDMLSKLLYDLELFKHSKTLGFDEIIDTVSLPYDAGKVRTTFTQILVQLGIFEAAKVLSKEELLNQSESSINSIVSKYFSFNGPSRFSRDWEIVMNEEKKLTDISLIIITLDLINNQKYLKQSIDLLTKFFDENQGAFSSLNDSGSPLISRGKKLLDISLLIIALNSLKKFDLLKDIDSIIDSNIDYIDQNFRHPFTGGFWDKANVNGIVSVDTTPTYYSYDESPFPIKSMTSHSVFLIALKIINRDQNKSKLKSIEYDVSYQLMNFFDQKNGGIALGQGNWFSTPTNPTVPLARHTMVPAFTIGSFSVGNTNYLPLHEKTASLQFLAMLAFDEEVYEDRINLREIDYLPTNFETKMDYIVSDQLSDNYFDKKKYIEWSKKTESGYAYGLTAYRSPLGFKSDRSPQNFSALHVVADMTLLGESIPNSTELKVILNSSQNDDGGFAEQASLLSELFTTYCVVFTEYILGDSTYDVEKCVNFVRSCQNPDGGFGNAPGYPSDIWHTNFGTLILHVLDAHPNDKEQLIQYLLNAQNSDGGFGVVPNGISETFSTFRAIDSLLVLGVDIPDKKKTTTWLQNLQDNSGGFYYQENKTVSFVGSYHAIGALYLLGELPKNVESAKKWIADHQSPDGGFSRAIGAPSDTTDEGFIAIHASYMLERKINPYWVAIIT
ncbi:prenyltransferase/squalene oxidase repeat-containing protein [Enterococcus sp. AZ163]|uniref:prenyltransferase/squalene oxidase repeat-containing protein n=1 Tax=Enterococcus sp. AZ163 TaxID=2774638 RepID=UPI003D29EDBD